MTSDRQPAASYVGLGLRILVVEPHPQIGDVLRYALEEGGHRDIWVAVDGEAALELARRLRPDLVLSEITLPRLDGLALVERLREADVQAPVIYLTSLAPRPEWRVRGVAGILRKPFQNADLLAQIASLRVVPPLRRPTPPA